MSPRLYRVILPVTDIGRAEEFYATLFQEPGERVSPGRHYFNLAGTILAVYDPVSDGDPLDGGWKHHQNQYIYIGVGDLEAAFDRAKEAGASLLSERIETMPWGERLFYARDPFQNPICLVDDQTLFMGSGR
ncbi:VOC family protein [Acidobacteria bacterium AH-259-L09]|nr:VOC family protein [Acidobacteria bacterium AH-259-L09]